MKLVLGSDHAGIELRRWLIPHLHALGHGTTEVGAMSTDSYDYPDAADALANAVASGGADYGILICGTGVGVSIRANRFPGIRCALCTTEFMAEMAREHNDANVLALGSRVIGTEQALAIVKRFLEGVPSPNPRHVNRVEKLDRPV